MTNAHVEFWKGEFGDSYVGRNNSEELLESNKIFFAQIFEHAHGVQTYLEVGANIGMNVQAIGAIRPDLVGTAIEPNHAAHSQLAQVTRTPREAIHASIQEFETSQRWDLVFTKGVLIHVTPDDLIGIYLSRSPVPHPKGSIDFDYYKQVCVYAFKKTSLLKFSDYDRSRNERIEDIEILRLIDNGIIVKFVNVNTVSVAVDTLKDYELVKQLMESHHV